MRGMVVVMEDLEDPVDGSDVRKVAMAAIGSEEEEEVGGDMVIVAVITVDAVVMVTR
jgi:hypothetical protein